MLEFVGRARDWFDRDRLNERFYRFWNQGSSRFSRDERDFLPAALEILENPPSPVGRAIGAAIIAVAAIALVWSIFGKVDIIATAKGRIVPIGRTKVIQPMQTGIVRAILVADGDHVNAGQVLVQLDPTESGADRERFRASLRQAQLNLARLRGLAMAATTRKDPELIGPPADATKNEIDETRFAMEAAWSEIRAKVASIERQIAEKSAEEAEADAAMEKLKATLPIVREQAQILEQSAKNQFGSRLQYLAASEKLAEQEHETAELTSHRDQARAARAALEQERNETLSGFASGTLDDLRKAQDAIIDVQADSTKADEKWRQQTLKSPTVGTVQQLVIHTVGGVVTPAQPLMVVVPDNAGLVVEANVENRDVGFVRTGQHAALKIEPFSFTRYGLIEGTVTELSHDTLGQAVPEDALDSGNSSQKQQQQAQQEQQSNYVAHIALSRDWMDTEGGRVRLGPGMAVTAEIQTGRRRIIDYLLSPLVRRVSESMHER